MIKAELDTEKELIKMETEGDNDQIEHELIAMFAAMLERYTFDDLLQMLLTAKDYNETGNTNTGKPVN